MKRSLRSVWLGRALFAAGLSVLLLQSVASGALAAQQPTRAQNTIYLAQIRRDLPLLNEAVQSIEPVASAGAVFQAPVDATLDPTAKNIYFIANSAQGMGVFKTGISGGTVVSLTVGTPFTTPLGLDSSSDGQTIFVADPNVPVQNQLRRPQLAKGMLFRLPASGGPAVAIAGTECTAPRGLTVVKENGADMIYFTGIDPHDDKPALLKIPAAGGTLTVISKGDPLVLPTSIAVDKAGTIYVTDQGSATNGLGNVFRFKKHVAVATAVEPASSHAEKLATLRGGDPAGVALTLDESLLLVSSLDETAGTSQVLVINMATLDQGIVNTVIGANHASGGLHRAANSTELVWVDREGLIYLVKLKP